MHSSKFILNLILTLNQIFLNTMIDDPKISNFDRETTAKLIEVLKQRISSLQKQNQNLKNQLQLCRQQLFKSVQKMHSQFTELMCSKNDRLLSLQSSIQTYRINQQENIKKILILYQNSQSYHLTQQKSRKQYQTQKQHIQKLEEQILSLRTQNNINLAQLSAFIQSQKLLVKQLEQLKAHINASQTQISLMQIQLEKQHGREYQFSHKHSVSGLHRKKVRSLEVNDDGQYEHQHFLKIQNQHDVKEYLLRIFKSEEEIMKWYRNHTHDQIVSRKTQQSVDLSKDGLSLDHSNIPVHLQQFLNCHWRKLQFIRFDHCKIGDHGLEQLIKHADRFSELKILCLHQNMIHQVREEGLSKFGCLQFIDITDNNLSNESISSLKVFKNKHPQCTISVTIRGRCHQL